MNKVLSGYFDDAHRGLQRQSSEGRGLAPSASNVQLPPLRPSSGPPLEESVGYPQEDKLYQSASVGSLGFSHEQAARGVEADIYQKAIRDSSKLARKVKALQDQLAITSAKKEAFKAQSQRLEAEFKKGREQSDTLQKELLEAKRDAGQLSKEAQEAVQMMVEMRKAHIHEVRLLQRGLASRGGDSSMKNRVNETADLVDKLGRAVVQRDEAIRDKVKLQSQVSKTTSDLRAVTDDAGRLKTKNKQLQDALKEAQRKARFVPPRPRADPPDDSDDEFEDDLKAFEKRFEILEEGPAGLDILASNLSKDKQLLEKRLRAQTEAVQTLTGDVSRWRSTCADKDEEIQDLNGKLEKMMRDQARLEQQIADKRREIEAAVQAERERLEAQLAEAQNEADDARQVADGMEKASDRLTKELVKVHEQFSRPVPAMAADGGASGAAAPATKKAEPDRKLVHSAVEQRSKTGEVMNLEVYSVDNGDVELSVREGSGELCVVKVGADLVKELEQGDPWVELCSRVGVDLGPPRRIVVSSLIARREVTLLPAETSVLLSLYKYSSTRFLISGLDLASSRLVELPVLDRTVTAEFEAKIKQCGSNDELFNALVAGVSMSKDADANIAFSASMALGI